jgi:hypothetical protein
MTAHRRFTTAREDHDEWLDEQTDFARVLHGNAFEGHVPRRRARKPSRMARLVRALLRWLAQPNPWRSQ